MLNKKIIVRYLRKTRLLPSVDYLRYLFLKLRNNSLKKIFLRENPGVRLPPDYLLYESFGRLNYYSYYFESVAAAKEILETINKYKNIDCNTLCEWGCGPARLLRHFRNILSDRTELWGTDFNPDSIKWCRENIPGINFLENSLHPPLGFRDDYFDIVYCVSTFTHLPRELQNEWLKECLRILKPDGIFYFTMHGDSFREMLLNDEKRIYDSEGFVQRGYIREGKKNFVSFNNPSYVTDIFLKNTTILEHIPGEGKRQDVWIIKK